MLTSTAMSLLKHCSCHDFFLCVYGLLLNHRDRFIYTRLPHGSCDMDASEVMRAADMQNKFGGYFTTLVMTRKFPDFIFTCIVVFFR